MNGKISDSSKRTDKSCIKQQKGTKYVTKIHSPHTNGDINTTILCFIRVVIRGKESEFFSNDKLTAGAETDEKQRLASNIFSLATFVRRRTPPYPKFEKSSLKLDLQHNFPLGIQPRIQHNRFQCRILFTLCFDFFQIQTSEFPKGQFDIPSI